MHARLRQRLALVAVGIAALVVAVPAPSTGQPAPPAPDTRIARTLEGSWELAVDRAEARRRIDGAIRTVTRQMVPIVSSIATGRLREYNPLASMVRVGFPGDRIRVAFDDRVFDTRAGYERTVTIPDQDPSRVRVHQAIRGGALVQVFSTAEGRRWNTLSVDDGDTLSFQVVIRSTRLPSDIRYQLPYRRAP